jgi:hypothetical protein
VWHARPVTSTPVTGPLAYVAAHRIAVVDERLPFELAYCLSRLVIEHGCGPLAPERRGTMSLKVFKALAGEDLVIITSEFDERLRPEVELTLSELFIDEVGPTPPAGLRITGFTPGRRNIDRFVEVTEHGADIVVTAVRAVVQDRSG